MAEYASKEDEASLVADWLREGKMNQSWSPGFPAFVMQQNNYLLGNPLLKKACSVKITGYRPTMFLVINAYSQLILHVI